MKDIIIIDGNNLLMKSSLKNSGGDDRLTLYEAVTSRLTANLNVIFFFDGFGVGKKSNIVYSNEKTADELMRNYIEKNYEKKKITVVSSDHGITELAMVCSCEVIKSEKFWKSINSPTKNKNINQLYIPPEEYEKPERMSKKDVNEFRKYFT